MRLEWSLKDSSSMTHVFRSSKWRKRTSNCWESLRSASSVRMSSLRRVWHVRRIVEWQPFWNKNISRNLQVNSMSFHAYLKCRPRRSTCIWAWASKSRKIAKKEGVFLNTWCQPLSRTLLSTKKMQKGRRTLVTPDTAKNSFPSYVAVMMFTQSRTISLNFCTINGEEDLAWNCLERKRELWSFKDSKSTNLAKTSNCKISRTLKW